MKQKMLRKERVLAALRCEEVDRTPISFWLFSPHVDQNPRALAETQVAFAKKYDLDFIKLTPFALYGVEDWGCRIKYFCTQTESPILEKRAINCIEDWKGLEVLPAYYGTMGKQVQFAQQVRKLVNDDIPFIQTIFSPLTTAHNLAGDRIFEDLENNPELIHNALEVISTSTANFIKANIEAGVSGFFFATKCASNSLISDKMYDEFGVKYDLRLFDTFTKHTFLNILHIHGDNLMFDKLVDYPCNCINWSDKWAKPSLAEARKITNKCLLGGINEKFTMHKGTTDEIKLEVQDAIRALNNKGVMIGPGCVADLSTPDTNFYAARLAVQIGI